MTPKRPQEVIQASKDIASAWDKYDAFIETGDKVGAKAAWMALEMLEGRYSTMYRQWQILGGTSDIETIAFPFADYQHADWLDEKRTQNEARM